MDMLIILMVVFGGCLGAEPTCSCSPFEYEEKLLTKMIRQEFIFEKLKDDILTVQNKVSDTLKEIDNERGDSIREIRTELDSLTKSLEEGMKTSKDEIKAELSAITKSYTSMMNTNSEQMKNFTEEFQKIKDSSETDVVAFFSKDVSDTSLSTGKNFIFTTTVLNEGNGYNNVTGQFTAPNGGSSHYIYYGIVTDYRTIQSGFFRDYDTIKCYTSHAISRLEIGEKVWLKCMSCSGSIRTHSFISSTFSGNRIKA